MKVKEVGNSASQKRTLGTRGIEHGHVFEVSKVAHPVFGVRQTNKHTNLLPRQVFLWHPGILERLKTTFK
jgi:hypothetical protein